MSDDTTNASLFNPDADPSAVDQAAGGDENQDFYAELVGEGKKYKDAQALAKAVAHANRHIQNLESEQAGLREDLGKRLTLEEAVAKMTEANAQKAPSSESEITLSGAGEPGANVGEQIKPGMSAEEIQALIESKINETEQVKTKTQNLSYVRSELEKTYGPSYQAVLNSKTQELGVTKEFLDDLAANHPKVFLETVGKGRQAAPNGTPPQSQVNTGATGGTQGNVRDQAYYRNLRRTDPQRYWAGATQSQMHRDADVLGDKFFS